ncbi:MAG TPA: DUF6640 family protein [Puia sp.]|nr:DUF6640 family protein [Puia sp.]
MGKFLISLVALISAVASYFYDWNRTHIFNPKWPPHAKFHNAQTMLLGTGLGLIALYLLWLAKADPSGRIKLATILAGLYFLTQAGAILFPGTALVDREFDNGSHVPAQLILDIVMLLMLSIGYKLEMNRIQKARSQQ